MTKRIVLIQHGHNPADDRVVTWLTQNQISFEIRKPFAGDLLSDLDESVAGVVIYGGPYSVFETDQHPFLLEEYRWIGSCLDAQIPMLGICQGAQQIAYHLGAWAGAPDTESHEFGCYRIDPVDDDSTFLKEPLWVAQAHYHTFDIPEGAVRLAGSDAFPNQAFRYGDNVYGLQFHAEQTVESFRRWQNADWAAYGKPGAQTREEQNALFAQHDEAQAQWFFGFMDTLFGHLK